VGSHSPVTLSRALTFLIHSEKLHLFTGVWYEDLVQTSRVAVQSKSTSRRNSIEIRQSALGHKPPRIHVGKAGHIPAEAPPPAASAAPDRPLERLEETAPVSTHEPTASANFAMPAPTLIELRACFVTKLVGRRDPGALTVPPRDAARPPVRAAVPFGAVASLPGRAPRLLFRIDRRDVSDALVAGRASRAPVAVTRRAGNVARTLCKVARTRCNVARPPRSRPVLQRRTPLTR
jgi:hypothetical protein